MNPRVVVDTNVLISAFCFGGKPERILELADRGKMRLQLSEYLLAELERILRNKFGFTEEALNRAVQRLMQNAEWVVPTETLSLCRDEADNRILECAQAGHADFIVTGDNDLLTLNGRFSIPILRPDNFLARFEGHKA
jgi:putative PIN family toxin of toxin-antitoxin system